VVSGVATLLLPRAFAARHAFRRGRTRVLVLALLTAVFWVGSFALFARVLEYFHTIADFGPLLTQRFLVLLFVTFFSVLLLSNTVSALTTFYLAGDVALLFAAPVGTRRLHHARFVETLISSSWMVLLFGLPAFLAYGVVYEAGPWFYVGTVATLLPFLVIPAAIGVLVTTALVLVFPARRARDGLLVLVGLLVGAAFILARTLRPERLAEPSGLVGFAAFLVGFGGEPSPYLPTTWAAEVLVPLLGAREGEPIFHLALLATTAAMLFLVSATVVERLFPTAWSRAQEGRVHAGAERALARWLRTITAPLPRTTGLLFAKDLAIFFRDASQWSQLLLLLALTVIYVYNFSVLPIGDESALGIVLRDVAAFCNLGLAAFVTTAVAVRFVYPMVSLEGRSWWILRSAPIPLESVWWSKFWLGYLPILTLGEVLVAATNHFLGVGHGLTLVFGLTLLPLLAAIVSLGLAFGAAYPRLDTQNAAQIATSFGAIVYMVSCLGLIGLVSALEAWPVSRIFWASHAGTPLDALERGLVALAFAATLVCCAVAFLWSQRAGVRALVRLQV
jgi:ABC-2 type transport system permease protein